MKTLFSLLIALSFGVTVFGQTSTTSKSAASSNAASKSTMAAPINASTTSPTAQVAPPEVTKGFDQKYPGASKVIWNKMSGEEWKAMFVYNGTSMTANFGTDGVWMESLKRVTAADLPKAVADAIKAGYATWTISSATKNESVKNGTTYQVHIKDAAVTKSVTFKEDGTPIAK